MVLVSAAISRFTTRLLARPLARLQDGITAVENGRLAPIEVSRTGDEIEFLGESFNRMIQAMAASQKQINEHQELLEKRIRERTAEFEKVMHAAQEANQAKSDFLANISHELRTPMNGVIGMLDIVLGQKLAPDQVEQLQTAQSCAYSLLALLNDILDLSKIEAGKMSLEKIPFDVRVVLDDCVKAHLPKAAGNRVDAAPRGCAGRAAGDRRRSAAHPADSFEPDQQRGEVHRRRNRDRADRRRAVGSRAGTCFDSPCRTPAPESRPTSCCTFSTSSARRMAA